MNETTTSGMANQDPLDMPLPCDIRVHGMCFSKGVKLRVFVEAAALLPCPFCGAEVMPRHALWASDGDVDSIIHAAPSPECGLGDFSVYSADDGKTVAAAWNRRAS